MVYLLYLLPLVFLGFLVVWVLAMASVLREERDLLWLVVLVIAPPIGLVAYWVNFRILDDEKSGLTAYRRRLKANRRIAELQRLLAENDILGQREELGRLYFELDRFDECLKVMKGLLDFDPENLRAQYQTALALKRTGRLENAVGHFEYLFDEDPGYLGWTMALEYLDLLEQMGRFDQGISTAERIRRTIAIPEVVVRHARLLIKDGRATDGYAMLEALLSEEPDKDGSHARRDRPWIAEARRLLGR